MVRVYMYEYYYHDMCVHMKVIIMMRMYEYTLRYTQKQIPEKNHT